MRKKHSFSEHNKVVSGSPHTFNQPAPEAGGAAGGGMDATGGGAAAFGNGGCMADGGKPEILGGGVRGTLADYGSALKQTASDVGDAIYDKIKSSTPKTQGAPGNHLTPEGYKSPQQIADEES